MKGILLLLATIPVWGHHSLAAEFDLDRPVTIRGAIVRVEWMNPHAWIYVDSPTEHGVERWAFEVGSPNELIRRGWSRTDLKVGTEITVEGILAKKLAHTANARAIVLADGKRILNGRAESK